jgi:hypothetical protein
MRTLSSGLGHNSRTAGGGRMYAIVVDLDTQVLKDTYPNDSYANAYADIRKYLTARGFVWKQALPTSATIPSTRSDVSGLSRSCLPSSRGSNLRSATSVCCGLRKTTT